MMACDFQLDSKTNLWTCRNCDYIYKIESDKPPRRYCKGHIKAHKKQPYQPKMIPCIHRGHELRKAVCTTCGRKGETESVFQCKLFTECTVRRFKRKQSEPKPCIICESREEVSYNQTCETAT